MNTRLSILLLVMLAFGQSFSLPSAAADPGRPLDGVPNTMQQEQAALQPCPVNASQDVNMAQIVQIDCCKGKKGICGCRAGKIVCCDGSASASPNCTCHADSGIDD